MRKAGLVSVVGIRFGTLAHVFAAALGVSTLLMTSITMFNVLKIAGGAYLIYLGVRTLLKKKEMTKADFIIGCNLKMTFWQTTIVNVLGPKTAIFFLAFLP
jgi:threonine/homoserine/homoserine lactone efflux protein